MASTPNDKGDLERSEIGRLVRLARCFGPEDEPTRGPVIDGEPSFELYWWLAPLAAAVRDILPDNGTLFERVRAAEQDKTLLVSVWSDVAQLPFETVQMMIDYVHRRRGLWELEDYANAD